MSTRYRTLVAVRDELTDLLRSREQEGGDATRAHLDEGKSLSRLNWPGLGSFWLTRAQVKVVKVLLDAYCHSRVAEVDQAALIRESGERVGRLAELFVGSGAWGTLVVPGGRPGSYRLADLPERPPA